MVTRGAVLSLWGIVLEQSLSRGGSEVEQRVSYRMTTVGLGGMAPRRLGGGTVWRRGGVDDKPGEKLCFRSTTLEMGSRRGRWR
jgi:hypothetical protein